jgi:hypothetical protein
LHKPEERRGVCIIVKHPWDPMVGISTPPKRGCGQLIYAGLCCSYVDIGKTLIPCMRVLGIVHAQDMYDHLIDDLNLAICFGVEGSGFGKFGI